MNLHQYLLRNKAMRKILRDDLEMGRSDFSESENGRRTLNPTRCVRIERLTAGAVRRQDLRPDDYWKIWPELLTAEDSPAQKEVAA